MTDKPMTTIKTAMLLHEVRVMLGIGWKSTYCNRHSSTVDPSTVAAVSSSLALLLPAKRLMQKPALYSITLKARNDRHGAFVSNSDAGE